MLGIRGGVPRGVEAVISLPTMTDALTGQTVELLQQLIRNQCVNDGTVASGQEVRTSDVLKTYLQGSGLDSRSTSPTARRAAPAWWPASRAAIPRRPRCA
jgi:hypothetical protein